MYTLVVLSLSLSAFLLSAEAQTCNATSLCPAAAPCCSEFGYCGTGNQFCLAGCNPFQSHTLDSCKPGPICKSTTYTFEDESRILTNSTLNDGDANKYDWVVDGGTVSVANEELSMLLTETNNGVRLSSTRFVHYGTITATMKTGRWNGVVAGFVTMSNIRDEIDWEFPGAATTEGQTNYFWQGLVTTPNHGGVSKGLSDTYKNYHDYTIVWSPDSLVFQIDKKTVRTIKRTDTIVDGVSRFPNTPSRIQFSLWPAGTSASAQGTIQWAGGLIDWNNKDYTAAGGHFTAHVKSVAVKCEDPTSPGASVQGYVYSGGTLSEPTIGFTDESPLGGNTTTPNTSTSASASSASTIAFTSTSATGSESAAATAASLSGSASVTVSSSDSSSAADNASSSTSDSPISTTTLGNEAVSAAPTSLSHGGSFFGNGGMDASSVSVSADPATSASVTGSDSLSASGTSTVTQASSDSVSASSASASPSKSAGPNAAVAVARGGEAYGVVAALFIAAVLL